MKTKFLLLLIATLVAIFVSEGLDKAMTEFGFVGFQWYVYLLIAGVLLVVFGRYVK